eukprot:scaffold61117_cov25-Tisochrysis_lutea.AAC.1
MTSKSLHAGIVGADRPQRSLPAAPCSRQCPPISKTASSMHFGARPPANHLAPTLPGATSHSSRPSFLRCVQVYVVKATSYSSGSNLVKPCLEHFMVFFITGNVYLLGGPVCWGRSCAHNPERLACPTVR